MKSKNKKKRMPLTERRKQIIDETFKLVARAGLHGVKTKDIARACNVSEAAIFRIFKSKQEILIEGIERKIGGTKRELIKKIKFDPKRPELAMKLMAEDMFGTIENNMDVARVIILTLIESPEYVMRHIKKSASAERKIIMKAMKEGMDSGLYKKMETETAAQLLPITIIGTIINQLLIHGKKLTKNKREKVINSIIEVYLHGIMKDKSGGK